MPFQAGDRVHHRYRVLEPLGQGGMASVFLIEDEARGQRRVLKQLHAQTPELLAAFRAEFALLAGLTHPRLTEVHDFGSTSVRGEVLHYYTAAWVEGSTLRQFARESGERWLAPFSDALEGLLALHELGVVHGDFTPDNVLVRRTGSGVLIDLGCARPRGRFSEQLAGTPGFIAPELASTGTADVGTDLYAVGVCLQQLSPLSGMRPRSELLELGKRLTAAAPRERPSDVRSVLAALGRHTAAHSGFAARSLRLVGRDSERAQFASWLEALRAGDSRPRVLGLAGRRGAGKSRLLRELCASAELSLRVLSCSGREAGMLATLLAGLNGSEGARRGVQGVLAALQALRQEDQPTLLVVDDAELASPEDAELLRHIARSLDPHARVGLLVAGVAPLPGFAAERLVLRALDAAALGAWTGNALSEHTLAELARACEGVPARIESALGRLTGAAAPSAPGPRRQADSSGLLSATAALGGLSREQQALLARVVALGGELTPEAAGLEDTALEFAVERGLLQRAGASLQLSALVELAELERALGRERMQESHRAVAAQFAAGTVRASSTAEQEAEVVRHLLLGGRAEDAALRLEAAEPLWRREPSAFARRLTAQREPLTANGLACVLEIAVLAQDARGALAVTARLLRQRPPAALRERARVLAADALTRLGRGARGARLLERVLSGMPSGAPRARVLLGLARARIQQADYAGVERAAREALALGVASAEEPLAHEALGVAALYGGQLAEARAHFAEALRLAPVLGARDRCRLFGYRAICAFRAGQPAQARDEHARALEVAEREGLDDLLATCHLNLGTALQQLGELGAALEQYARGLGVARAVGRENTEIFLAYNQLNLRVELGDFERVRSELELLAQRAEQAKLPHFLPALALVRAESALGRGALEEADSELAQAARGFSQLSLEREQIETELGRAELELQRGLLPTASERATAAEERARELDASDLLLRAAIVHVRIGARRQEPLVLERARGAEELAERSGQLLLAARLATELCFAAEACGAPRLAERFDAARRTWDHLAAQLPEELRQVFWADPRRAGLLRFTQAVAARSSGSQEEPAALRRLLSLSRRINSSLSLERVLEYAVEAAVELCGAERGFLFLREPDGSVRLSTRVGADTAAAPSSNIVQRVLASGEALLTTDAGTDLRLASFGSVHAQRLKAVLCVPVATPAEALGALYVDSRLERTRLTEPARELLLSLSDHVAVALGNARLHAELTRRSQQLEAEKRTVERLSSGKDRELVRLREQLEAQRRTLEFRYDYKQIAGRGQRMSRVLHELDRIIDSDVNVLIQGESGTGKELIARAIHVHGARREGPFVGVNCASIPEALLESELFGHVRGAFTGAERDKTGLMLAANGGTLFLDELGELSPMTQAKLLRVLQEREVRPLGAERTRPLDVRLVCATHRELAREVEAGHFRQDLYYRVAVLEVRLPALRERIEDLPELCRSILERAAQNAGRTAAQLSPEALRALAGYAFPGNVRELENILTRALVLSGRTRLGAEDLDLERAPPRARSLHTRQEYESEERERILHALRGARWNVSVVSRSLGIPRNTLYRKLQRYGLTRPEA